MEKRWRETEWTEAQAAQVMGRIDNVLTQLPQAIEQAYERIIRGNTVENSEKIASIPLANGKLWSVIAHNLWTLARLEVADEVQEALPMAA